MGRNAGSVLGNLEISGQSQRGSPGELASETSGLDPSCLGLQKGFHSPLLSPAPDWTADAFSFLAVAVDGFTLLGP